MVDSPTQTHMGIKHACTTANARVVWSRFVTNASSRCITSVTTPVENANDRLGMW